MRFGRALVGATVAAATILVAVAAAAPPSFSPNVTVFASGLNNPRGLTFGPDGNLYVAEGGLGGAMHTGERDCPQVAPPVGPYSGGYTARISRIDAHGSRTTVVEGLPSSQTSPALGGLTSGIADVKFVDGKLYALESGAGCSHGLGGTDNWLIRVNADNSVTPVADLSAFIKAHPVAHPNPPDFEPDGTWFSMAAVGGDIYAVEPNHGEVDRVSTATGAISRVADISASYGHIVPTSIAFKNGSFAIGNLDDFPVDPGASILLRMDRAGTLSTWATDFTTELALVFGSRDRLYVLESMTAPGLPGPDELGTGRVVELNTDTGARRVIATGLSFPTGMTMGPDGALYVSNVGFGAPAGAGQVVRITVP